MDVDVIGDELHFRPTLHGRNDGAGGTVGDAGHGVVQVGHVGGTGVKSGNGGVIVGAGVGQRDADLPMALFDELQRARLLRGNVHQLDETVRPLLQAAEHLHIGLVEVLRVLRAHLVGADERALHVDANKIGTLAVFVSGCGIHDAVQDLFGECHGGGADGQHALAGLKIRQRLDGFFLAVTEILAHGTVEVDIHEARQGIEALCVQNFLALLGGSKGHNAALPDDDAPLFKRVAGSVDQSILNDHNRLRASSSATRMQSGCICRMEPGHSGVTGPETTALTALALARPLATTSTLRACMMVLMPMV